MKWFEKYGSWIVEKYGKYGRKASWIVKWFEKYGSWIVKWYGNCGRKFWKDMENMEENCEMWNDMENMEERQVE